MRVPNNMCAPHPLTERIRQTAGITVVFVNVERLSALSEVSASETWILAVLGDRFGSLFILANHFRGSLRKPGG